MVNDTKLSLNEEKGCFHSFYDKITIKYENKIWTKIQNIQNNVRKAISEKSYHYQNTETHNFKHRCPSKIAQKFSKYTKIPAAGTIEITFNSNGSAINWLDFEEGSFHKEMAGRMSRVFYYRPTYHFCESRYISREQTTRYSRLWISLSRIEEKKCSPTWIRFSSRQPFPATYRMIRARQSTISTYVFPHSDPVYFVSPICSTFFRSFHAILLEFMNRFTTRHGLAAFRYRRGCRS